MSSTRDPRATALCKPTLERCALKFRLLQAVPPEANRFEWMWSRMPCTWWDRNEPRFVTAPVGFGLGAFPPGARVVGIRRGSDVFHIPAEHLRRRGTVQGIRPILQFRRGRARRGDAWQPGDLAA